MEKNIFNLVFGGLLLITMACEKEKTEIKTDTKYTENTTVIDSSTNSQLIMIDSTKLVFSTKTEITENIKIGDILISRISSNAPQGYLRKVNEISEENGQLIVETEQAQLTDAFSDITIDTTVIVNASNTLKSASTKFNAQGTRFSIPLNKVIYDADNNTTTVSDQINYNGELTIDVTYNFKLKIKSGQIEQFELSSSTINTLSNRFFIGKDLGSFKQEITLLIIPLPPIEPSGIVLVPYLKIYIGAEGQINVSISATQTATYTAYAGLKKENGSWKQFSDQSFNGNISFNGINISATAMAYVKPSLDIEFFDYKNAKAQIYVQGYARLDANPLNTPSWTFYAGIDAKAELTLNVLFGLIDFNITQDIFDYSWPLATSEQNIGTVTDYDGNVYNTVTIGTQVWMKENLKTTHYANGTAIPLVTGTSNWEALRDIGKAYCWYNDDIANKATYGALYTWAAAMNGAASTTANPSGIQGVCPTGWHLPSDAEWTQMENYLADNGYNYDGTIGGGRYKIAKSLASTSGWLSASDKGAVGNTDYPAYRNKSGFTALAGGYRFVDGSFDNTSWGGPGSGLWWTATESVITDEYGNVSTNTYFAWCRYMDPYHFYVDRSQGLMTEGYSVRCVRD